MIYFYFYECYRNYFIITRNVLILIPVCHCADMWIMESLDKFSMLNFIFSGNNVFVFVLQFLKL